VEKASPGTARTLRSLNFKETGQGLEAAPIRKLRRHGISRPEGPLLLECRDHNQDWWICLFEAVSWLLVIW